MVVMKVETVVMEVALMVVMEVAMKVVVKMVVIWCARCRLRMVERDALNTLIRAHLLRFQQDLHFKLRKGPQSAASAAKAALKGLQSSAPPQNLP